MMLQSLVGKNLVHIDCSNQTIWRARLINAGVHDAGVSEAELVMWSLCCMRVVLVLTEPIFRTKVVIVDHRSVYSTIT